MALEAKPTTASEVNQLTLSPRIITRADVSRLVREIEGVDDFFHQAAVRGKGEQALPRLSSLIEGVAADNKLNLLHGDHRAALKKFLSEVKKSAPIVHVAFASDPSGDFLTKLLTWFRTEAHPHVLLHVGLQPELAAGCVIRTTNKLFDFSFRAHFEKSKPILMKAIEGQS